MDSVRIIQLPTKSAAGVDDYIAVDSIANGTKKIQFPNLLDNGLTIQNKAADAKATGDAINDAIGNEASTRQSADANLQTQIDQLIAPSGEAPSAAEIENARIGAPPESIVYSTLGDAIRGQFTGVKDDLGSTNNTLVNVVAPTLTPFTMNWEQGGFNVSTGAKVSNDNYIRTTNFLVVDYIQTIHIENLSAKTQALSIMRYNNLTGAFIERISGDEIMTAAGYSRDIDVSSLTGFVRFHFKYSPTEALTPTDGQYLGISTTNKLYSFYNDTTRDIDYINGQSSVTESKSAVYPTLSWAQGSVNTTNMYAEVDSLLNYIRSNILTVSAVDKLNVSTSLTDSYFVYCRCYDKDGNQISSTRKSITSTNILEFDVSEATFVRLIVGRTDTTINVLPSLGASFGCYFNNQIVNRMIDSEIMSNLMASFKRFAVIGDSLSAGHIYPDPSTTSGNFDDKSIAWGTWITRKLNNTYYNFSRAGMDAYQFVRGIREADQSDLGDNKLAVALDGNHDVPMYIINLGVNNPHSLALGTTADIDLSNPDNNGDTIIGWYSKLVQKISNYYYNKSQSVHIVLNVYGFMPAGGEGDVEERLRADGRITTWTNNIYNYIKSTIEGQGNYLYFLDLYSNDPEVFRNELFLYDGAVVQKHWTSVGYNAVGMAILRGMNNLMWDNSSSFKRIEFIASNSYIESYNNPSNFT